MQGIFCEYSVKTGLNDLWKYDLPRIRDWNDLNIKSLNESVESLPDGYKTNKVCCFYVCCGICAYENENLSEFDVFFYCFVCSS